MFLNSLLWRGLGVDCLGEVFGVSGGKKRVELGGDWSNAADFDAAARDRGGG